MEEEVEILKTIFEDGILNIYRTGETDQPVLDVLILSQNSEDDQDDQKLLRLNLIIEFPLEYPDKIPKFTFKNAKGIIEEDLEVIEKKCYELANKNIGTQMLYEIIEATREELTNLGNVPKSCNCAICLYDFDQNQTKSIIGLQCYHYFHMKCLQRHVDYMQADIDKERNEAERNKLRWKSRSVSCPICRKEMALNEITQLKDFASQQKAVKKQEESLSAEVVIISDRMRRMQHDMRVLYEKQLKIDGIILPKVDEVIVLARPTPANESDQLDEELHAQLNIGPSNSTATPSPSNPANNR